MMAKCGTRVAGSLVIGLCVASAVSGGGSLFVTYGQGVPIKRLDSQSFQLLGEIGENYCCTISNLDGIDPYRRYILANGQKRDLDFNPISQATDIGIYSNFEAISNSYWDMGSNDLLRKAYDGEKSTQRLEAAYATAPLHTNEKNVVGSEDNVFFSLDKTIYSLNGPIVELPFTMFGLKLQAVKDGHLYFAYRPSTTSWHDIFRIRTDGNGLEQLATGLQRIGKFDVDPTTETIYYTGGINTAATDHLQNLYTLNFGDSGPTLICEDCATDVVFVADDEWLLPGDTDLDHDIDITDFNALASNFSPELERDGPEWAYKTVRQGDFNGDWRIDITDFTVLANNFAPSGYPGPYDGMGVSDVPEPSPLVLALLAAILTGISRRLSKNNCD